LYPWRAFHEASGRITKLSKAAMIERKFLTATYREHEWREVVTALFVPRFGRSFILPTKNNVTNWVVR
jgi:hypothetical protein